MRYRTLHAYYLDLGIMHQTVYNTYRALTNLDWSRVLEHTEPFGISQVKRMAIHNDIILAPLAIFYLIYASPATLLIIQAALLGLGAWFIFKIAQLVFEKSKYRDAFSLLFSIGYLFYPPLQKANMFDFHGVTLATTFLLAMFYFWIKKRYGWSFLFVFLALITKEQVGLTTAFFGLYTFFFTAKNQRKTAFSFWIVATSLMWFVLSVFVIIPYFRGGSEHFALEYYRALSSPINISQRLFGVSTWSYLLSLLGPTGFLSLLSPLQLLIAAPEFGINLLSGNPNLRNIYYHYTSVITPFVYISSIYGANVILNSFQDLPSKNRILKRVQNDINKYLAFFITIFFLLFAYLQGPLPLAKMQEVRPFVKPFKEASLAADWSVKLKDEKLKISTSGKLAPYFSSRRYFYNFSQYYEAADYVVIMPEDVYNYSVRESLVPAYRQLQNDKRFELIFKQNNFEVYKKI